MNAEATLHDRPISVLRRSCFTPEEVDALRDEVIEAFTGVELMEALAAIDDGDETLSLSVEREFGGTRCPPVIMLVRAAFYDKETARWLYVNRGFTRKDQWIYAAAVARQRGAEYVQVLRGDVAWEQIELWRKPEGQPDRCAMCGTEEDVTPSPRIRHKLCPECMRKSERLAKEST